MRFASCAEIAAASALFPFTASAQDDAPPLPEGGITKFSDIANVLDRASAWLFWILMFLAVIFILVAAYRYLTSAGDPEKVRNASKTFVFAAIAIAVALLAEGIPNLVASFLGYTF